MPLCSLSDVCSILFLKSSSKDALQPCETERQRRDESQGGFSVNARSLLRITVCVTHRESFEKILILIKECQNMAGPHVE